MQNLDLNHIKVAFIDTKENLQEIVEDLQIKKIKIVLLDNFTDLMDKADTIILPTIFRDTALIEKYSDKIYMGPEYIPVSEPYIGLRNELKIIKSYPKHIMVTMGGSDPNQLTKRIISILDTLSEDIVCDIIIGPAFVNKSDIYKIKKTNLVIHEGLTNLSSIMLQAYLGITAVGTTIYEFAAIGTPMAVIGNYKSDLPDLQHLSSRGIAVNLGYHQDVSNEEIKSNIQTLLNDDKLWTKMRDNCHKIIDGKGLSRICKILADLIQ